MTLAFRNRTSILAIALVLTVLILLLRRDPSLPPSTPVKHDDGAFRWSDLPLHYPIERQSMKPLPTAYPLSIPRIQHRFGPESTEARRVRLQRREAVRSNFTHAWNGYKANAWMRDEVRPLSGGGLDTFGGWAATLVDALDTLWIMGLHDDFGQAVKAIEKIDFSASDHDEINVFETTIRYLGGFLAAYDLSNGKYPSLLRKAIELGDMLYVAFDTPNHMPTTRWKFKQARNGAMQVAADQTLVAEIGSLTLEFTRLSQVSGDPKYYDVVQRVMDVFEASQDRTKLPGMWPVVVNANTADFTDADGFTLGGMADSTYEYLPKQYLLLGGASQQYRDLYVKAIAAIKRNIFYRPRAKVQRDMLLPGDVSSDGKTHPSQLVTEARAQHLGCFAGGMVGLAARAFELPHDMTVARQLVEGCLWAYESSPSGMMPEIIRTTKCPAEGHCIWNEEDWHKDILAQKGAAEPEDNVESIISQKRLTPGITNVDDRRYILRPEMIESVFILYRLTGDASLMDRAWAIFETIIRATKTDIAHAALDDCTNPQPETTKADRMESFWLAETLKYFYLIFDSPDVMSLDEYVLNTEAHPLRRPKLK